MKDFIRFFIVQVAILIIMIILLVAATVTYKVHPLDKVVVNDCIETVVENWDSPEKLESAKFDIDILVLDRSNHVVYSSSDSLFKGIKSPLDALEKDMVTVAVNEDERFLGTCIIPNPSKTNVDRTMYRIIVIVVIVSVAMLLSYASFYYFVNRNIIKPFNRMKKFASMVAMGDLDEPLAMEKNNIFGIFTESFDIMREELKAAREREIALKLKEKELVASLSHDLKTPVTGIRVICEMLQVKAEDEYVKQKIDNIWRKTVEINTLLDDLLSSTLEDMGELKVSLAEVSSDILAELVSEHDTRKLVQTEEVPKCVLSVDKKRLSQIIGNIIGNSYKYANTEIDITYQYKGEFLEMKIIDHGEGVEEEELSLLTNKFFRGTKNTADKEGSGLGLYISSGLMEKMNGQLICSNEEEGFSVTLMIPLA